MSDWQQIETCPRDGTYFVAYDSEAEQYYICFWDKREKWFSDGDYTDSIMGLTHWMPLPPAPPFIKR